MRNTGREYAENPGKSQEGTDSRALSPVSGRSRRRGTGRRAFRAIAIAGGTAKAPALPCGACRQALAEFCDPEMPVAVLPLRRGAPVVRPLSASLPYSFALS